MRQWNEIKQLRVCLAGVFRRRSVWVCSTQDEDQWFMDFTADRVAMSTLLHDCISSLCWYDVSICSRL